MVRQRALGRTDVNFGAGLGDPQTGLGEMQLRETLPGRPDRAAAGDTNAQLRLSLQATAQLGQAAGIGMGQAGVQIQHQQALGTRRRPRFSLLKPTAGPQGEA